MSYPTIKVHPIVAILTGHTCGTAGGERPVRTRKVDGNFYELVAVGKYRDCFEEEKRISDERFPGLDYFAYGDYCQEKTRPVLTLKLSYSAMRWPEVQAVDGAEYAVWARPAGTRYLVRGPNHRAIYNDS